MMHMKLYVLDNILKLKSKATIPMYRRSNFSKLFIQNVYWLKAHLWPTSVQHAVSFTRTVHYVEDMWEMFPMRIKIKRFQNASNQQCF